MRWNLRARAWTSSYAPCGLYLTSPKTLLSLVVQHSPHQQGKAVQVEQHIRLTSPGLKAHLVVNRLKVHLFQSCGFRCGQPVSPLQRGVIRLVGPAEGGGRAADGGGATTGVPGDGGGGGRAAGGAGGAWGFGIGIAWMRGGGGSQQSLLLDGESQQSLLLDDAIDSPPRMPMPGPRMPESPPERSAPRPAVRRCRLTSG